MQNKNMKGGENWREYSSVHVRVSDSNRRALLCECGKQKNCMKMESQTT
jgi:hypothetical protein